MAKKIINVFTTILLVVLVVFVVAMFLTRLTGNTPEVFGFRVYRVATGSMEPNLAIDDVILIKSTSAEDIHKGDIITYLGSEGTMNGYTVTHRVIEEPVKVGSRYTIQTKGDVVGALPDPVITDDMVIGKFICKLPLLDKLYSFFNKPYGLVTFIAVIIALFGYEMISIMISYRSLDKIDDEYDKLDALMPAEADKDTETDAGEKSDSVEDKPDQDISSKE